VGSMSTGDIVDYQTEYWLILPLFPAFLIYVISMVGETNRLPFDLPEAEGELVSGYMTEYSSMKFAWFFLAEYINMATVSAVCTTLFLGGYLTPWPLNNIEFLNNPWFGPLWFVLKVQFLFSVFVWLRGTLPRFRYDQFMNLGWKVLIELALIWIIIIALVANTPWRNATIGLGLLVMLGLYWLFGNNRPQSTEPEIEVPTAERFDAFAGGYPVPPMPGQELPELVGVLAGAPAEETFDEVATEGKDS